MMCINSCQMLFKTYRKAARVLKINKYNWLIKSALCKRCVLNQVIEILNKFKKVIFIIPISIETIKKFMNKTYGIKNFRGTMKYKVPIKKYLEMKNLEKTKLK